MAQVLHATTVSFAGNGLLILGPSGAGKSGLALGLMAYGARLVADDRTALAVRDGAIWASAPPGLPPLIEARGLGLLNADPLPKARLALVADLGRDEADRLPPQRVWRHAGVEIPLVYRAPHRHFEAGLIQYLRAGRRA